MKIKKVLILLGFIIVLAVLGFLVVSKAKKQTEPVLRILSSDVEISSLTKVSLAPDYKDLYYAKDKNYIYESRWDPVTKKTSYISLAEIDVNTFERVGPSVFKDKNQVYSLGFNDDNSLSFRKYITAPVDISTFSYVRRGIFADKSSVFQFEGNELKKIGEGDPANFLPPPVGAKLGDFTVIKDESDEDNLVTFSGETVLEGRVFYNEMTERVCFNVSDSYKNKIPRVYGDKRDPWFCFDQEDNLPKDLLKSSTSPQTIKIRGYQEYSGSSEGNDWTVIAEILSK